MKKTLIFLLCFICLLTACNGTLHNWPNSTPCPTTSPTGPNVSPCKIDNFKAMWLSQFDLSDIYFDHASGTQQDINIFTEKITFILSNIKKLGFNTVILQIRPNGDSMYPSTYYPMSKYVVGKYGNTSQYDPVAITVDLAHSLELDIHAWINPMRTSSAKDITGANNNYLIKQWYEDNNLRGKYLVEYNNIFYLNPAYEQVRQLIIDGAVEALTKYDFDGLHMDDYFYPTTESYFDRDAYEEYISSGEKATIPEFRRLNLNKLVSGLFKAVKDVNPDLIFGISPSGIINTVYNQHCADVYTWCSSYGYIDYICPQVYFGLKHQTYDFASVCNTYRNIIKTEHVRLIIGMSFGKALSKVDNYAGSGKFEWQESDDIMARCFNYTKALDGCAGICVFCYQYFYNPASGVPVEETKQEVANFIYAMQNHRF